MRFDAQRLTESVGFWLGIVIVVNILLVGFFFDPSPAAVESAEVHQPPLEPQLRLLVELSDAERLELAQRHQAAIARQQAAAQQALPAPIQAQAASIPAAALPAASIPAAALPAPAVLAIEAQPPVCRMWGPYNDEMALSEVRQQIADVAENLEVRASQIQGSPDYLVYVDTQANIDTARRMQRELDSQNFEAYLMSGGAFANALSVGVFSQRARAENQREAVAGLGYEVAIEALPRSQEVYHLLAQVPADYVPDIKALGASDATSVITPAADCAAIASAG